MSPQLSRRGFLQLLALGAAAAAVPAIAGPTFEGVDLASGPDSSVWYVMWNELGVRNVVPLDEWQVRELARRLNQAGWPATNETPRRWFHLEEPK